LIYFGTVSKVKILGRRDEKKGSSRDLKRLLTPALSGVWFGCCVMPPLSNVIILQVMGSARARIDGRKAAFPHQVWKGCGFDIQSQRRGYHVRLPVGSHAILQIAGEESLGGQLNFKGLAHMCSWTATSVSFTPNTL
jgi:hypothetical protein